MSPADRRLVALLATHCPARTGALLGRLSGDPAGDLARQGRALAAAPRRARLVALASALAAGGWTGPAAVGGHPLLARLTLEAAQELGSAPRTEVRPAAPRADGGPWNQG